ncbi:MAG: ParM/StbA family protein [Oscillospiraceae bacterium]|nr:ParM/StbA family protein [Oscillospiraceae bacterium]
MNEAITIGVDHGYAAIKSTHCAFPTGLVGYEYEPYTQKDVLEYGGKFYVVGSGRQPLQKDKTITEDYYLLTLAAIAKELACRGADTTAAVHLAAGLPLTSFGRDKKKFRAYLLRDGQPVSFRYEGIGYTVTITEVSLFPQGYTAVLTQRELLDEPSVIVADIGGWTVDLMRLDNKIPNAATCRSLELGMIRCLDEISEQVRRALGLSMTAAQIESCLRGEARSVDENAKQIIHREAGAYVRRVLSAVAESGLDARAMPAVFLGGGAALLKRHVGAADGLFRPFILDDVCLNAKGYERLVGQMSRSVKGGG